MRTLHGGHRQAGWGWCRGCATAILTPSGCCSGRPWEQYVRECCAAGLPIIHDRSRTIRQRLDDMAALTLETEQNARYHAFYHRPENQSIHEELNWRICAYLTPHVAEELEDACQRGELRLEHPALAASYLLHGQIGLLGEHAVPLEERVALLRRYAGRILEPEY